MDKLSEIKQIWRDRFSDSRQWMTEVFTRVYRDEEAKTLVVDDRVVSMLLLRRMQMDYLGRKLQMGYIYGAATSRQEQGKGFMTRLLKDSLNDAYRRGDVLTTLIPARRRLYGFYSRFDFAGVFYIDEQRYTAVHRFEFPEDKYMVEQSVCDADEFTRAYERLAQTRPCYVMHNEGDMRTILIDNDIDNGMVAVARDIETGRIEAIGFALASPLAINVRDIVYSSEDAMNAVLQSFADRRPGVMTIIDAYPPRKDRRLSLRGMARIVNVEKFLEALAEIDPGLHYTLRVTDPIIPENNDIFIVSRGKVSRASDAATSTAACTATNAVTGTAACATAESDDPHSRLKIDLDVDIRVLTEILFSSPEIGAIFNLPTARPYISLMLN